jgi:hypothetical protein
MEYGGAMKKSLLKAAENYSAPKRATWFTKLQSSKPDLAQEVESLLTKWKAGQTKFPTLHELAYFIAEYERGAVGASYGSIIRWAKEKLRG